MGKILCLETATEVCSVALGVDGVLTAEENVDEGLRHSSVLTSMIDRLLKSQDLTFQELDAVAISNGPGSYTGLRVGASTAKAICYATDLPMITISSLEALAQPFLSSGQLVLATLDARRMEVYAAYYGSQDIVPEPKPIIWDETVVGEISGAHAELIICGTGIEKARSLFESTNITIKENLARASNLVALAQRSLKAENYVDIAYHSPFYLKSPNITQSKKRLL